MSQPFAFLHGAFGRIGLVDMDSDLAVHVHPHLHAVIKAGGADTRFLVRERTVPVADDRAVLVNAWEPHAWQRAGEGARTLVLTLYLEAAWLRAEGFGTAVDGGRGFFAAPSAPLSRAAREVADALVDLVSGSGGLGRGAPSAAEIAHLVKLLVGELGEAAQPRGPAFGGAGRAFDYRIRRAIDLLRVGAGPVRLDHVARDVGLSRPRFFELFQECAGFTPSRLVNAVRMERAISLLTTTRLPMADMADSLGFATQGNFSRFFRQQIGVSPHSFRRAAIPVRDIPVRDIPIGDIPIGDLPLWGGRGAA